MSATSPCSPAMAVSDLASAPLSGAAQWVMISSPCLRCLAESIVRAAAGLDILACLAPVQPSPCRPRGADSVLPLSCAASGPAAATAQPLAMVVG